MKNVEFVEKNSILAMIWENTRKTVDDYQDSIEGRDNWDLETSQIEGVFCNGQELCFI